MIEIGKIVCLSIGVQVLYVLVITWWRVQYDKYFPNYSYFAIYLITEK